MSDAARRVQGAARDARSTDDLVDDGVEVWDEKDMFASPLDKETLDEQHSTQMGDMYESQRRGAN